MGATVGGLNRNVEGRNRRADDEVGEVRCSQILKGSCLRISLTSEFFFFFFFKEWQALIYILQRTGTQPRQVGKPEGCCDDPCQRSQGRAKQRFQAWRGGLLEAGERRLIVECSSPGAVCWVGSEVLLDGGWRRGEGECSYE